MKNAVDAHTREVLTFYKAHDIDVRWIEIGNETTHGMLWEMGRAETQMENYCGLTEAGCLAAKSVYPDAKTIIHIDGGVDPQRYNVLLNAFEVNHVHYDWVGLA